MKFLFLPLHSQDWTRVPTELILLLVAIAIALFVESKMATKRTGAVVWPKFLSATVTILLGLVMVGALGATLNTIMLAYNYGSMPVVVQKPTEWAVTDHKHIVGTPETPLMFLSDYINVNEHLVLFHMFPSYDYVSPGDLMMAASVILSWWLLLIFVVWAAAQIVYLRFSKK